MASSLTDKQKHRIKNEYQRKSTSDLARTLRVPEELIIDFIQTLPPPITQKKRLIFTLITILIPILILVLLEIGLQIFQYGGNFDLFIQAPEEVSDYYICNHDVADRYFFIQSTRPSPQKDLLLKKKPENDFRIFVMGGSTTAGYPYGNNLMFSRILHKKLCDVFPNRKIEVINTAMSAVNTYTLLDFTDEIIKQDPDAILIYAGHNEYYGAMGVASMESLGKNRNVVKAYLQLKRFRLFILIRDIVGKVRIWTSKLGKTPKTDSQETLMARIVSDQDIPMDSKVFDLGIKQFEGNLSDILKKFHTAGIPVVLSDLVCNLRDQRPFVSKPAAGYPAANDVFQQARSLDLSGQYADNLYRLAKALDALRFRAPEAINEVIYRLAEQYQYPVVPMRDAFNEASLHRLVGDNLMTDHLHPNMHGYFLMAEAFFQTMKENHLIDTDWPEENIKPINSYESDWGISGLDSAYSDLSIQFLKGGWPFHPKTYSNTVLQNFRPQSLDEQMAFRIMTKKEKSLETGHVKLAQYYEKNKNFNKAFEIYKTLCYTIPYESEFFEKSIRIAINLKKYDEAFSLLQFAEEFRPTPFVNKWMGQLNLMDQNIGEAVPYLERAYLALPNDEQLIYNLGKSYILQMKFDKTDNLIKQLDNLPKGKMFSQKLKYEYQSTFNELKKVQPLLTNANNAIEDKNINKAYTILTKAQNQFPTPTGYHWLGMIYFQQKKYDKAILSLKEANRIIGDNESVLYHLAMSYIQTEQISKAKMSLRNLRQLDNDFPDPYNLQERLF